MDLEDMLSRVTAELDAAEAELVAATKRREELRTIQQGIKLAMARYGGAVATPTPSAGDTTPPSGSDGGGANVLHDTAPASHVHAAVNHVKSERNQSDRCVETLREIGRPASTVEVRERLRQRGYEYDAEQIRSTLHYLRRKERVIRTAPGVWAVPDDAAAGNGASAQGDAGRMY